MSRIADAFAGQKSFIAFITGGDPDIETTEKLILAMAEAGADLIEIGVPFSDPVAEGIVIQEASARALTGGCTVDGLFAMVKNVREKTEIPLLFMTYFNPVYTYGKERFLRESKASGIDGIIVPDLPFEENEELSDICHKHGIDLISMIAPTSAERIAMIARAAEGFLYCVSSLGVTGVRGEIKADIGEMVRQAKKVTDIPCAVGFGIATPEQARNMSCLADGVIVGSAIVKLVAEFGRESVGPVREFVRKMKDKMTNIEEMA